MTIKVGINGFGRMGRLALRAGWEREGFDFIQVNETACKAKGSAHLLKYDSVHGTWDKQVEGHGRKLIVDGHKISYTHEKHLNDVDWSDCDMVIEATGKHHKKVYDLQSYFDQGVKKVVVAAPTEQALNIVYGVNHELYDHETNHLVTAASCTTNCLAPVVKVMQENVGIVHGSMTTIHNITNTQAIVDKGHKDLRRARSCGTSLIPTTTGSAKAICKIFPELEGRLNGHAVRVPLTNASLTDFVFEAERDVTADEINQLFKQASENELKGILGYEESPLVSVDYVNDPRSTIIDALSTMVINDRQVKIYAWYDNEWGYVNRLIDIVSMIVTKMK